MGQKKGSTIENTFGQGLITEATGLNFPKDAALSVLNCLFNQDMSVSRRYGFDYETGSTNTSCDFDGSAVSSHLWKNVAGVADRNFSVIQVGSVISAFNNSNAQSVSANRLFQFDLNSYKVSGAPDCRQRRAQYTEGFGYLFIAHPYCDPLHLIYNQATGTIIVQQNQIMVRDFNGVNETVPDYVRPTTLTIQHKYNLYNQGWDVVAPCGVDDKNIGPSQNVLAYWHSATGTDYPSNIDYWWSSKDALKQMNVTLFNAVSLGSSLAPRGHFIFNAFYIDRAATLGNTDTRIGVTTGSLTDLVVESAGYNRPSSIAFYSGRVFYSGVEYNSSTTNYSNKIYFSRIIEKDLHIGQCYQDGDPTAEEGSDLLPSDGGVISSPEIGTIYKMFPMGYSLILFASNGVWSISGSSGVGFTAKDYSIAKVSSQGMVSATSFVDMDGTPLWWSKTGVCVLAGSDEGGSQGAGVGVQSLSDKTIKTFIRNIPPVSKYTATGSYNRDLNTIYWLYRSTPSTSSLNVYQYDTALVFNTLTKAFSVWSLPTTNTLFGALTIQSYDSTTVTKFFVNTGNNYTLAECRRTDYYDYGTQDYNSYVDTGYSLNSQGITRFYTPYVWIYLNGQIGGEINFCHKWDFSNTADIGKYSTRQNVKVPYGYDYQTVRKKVRGSGRAVVLRFESTSGQPFSVIGWTTLVSANGGP